MQQRRDTAANWTSNNPTLAAGELGLETDTGKIKIGTGSAAWTALAYAATGTVTSITAGTGLSGGTITSSGTIAINTAVTADLTTAQTLTNKTLTTPQLNDAKINLAFDAQTGTTYTVVLSDSNQVVTMNNAATNVLSIPTNASVAYPLGTQINVLQIGAGQTTISAVTSGTTTILSTAAVAAAPKLRARYSSATCIKADTDLWYIIGDIA
jgi:hypothetical protein